ncbi:MAG: type II toxin-antitoxin system RelE/ParE family toxin [Pseudomonadota bacterium]
MVDGPAEPRLTPAARRDLEDIWDWTAEAFSPDQADAYLRGLAEALSLIAAQPGIGRERPEIAPPVRLHPWRSHLIVYRAEAEGVLVIRVPHARRDWRALLEG